MNLPNLVSDLIIGCDFLIEWEASIDFERCALLMKDGMGELITPFINEDVKKEVSENVCKEEQLQEETFFVECIDLKETKVVRLRHVSDKYFQLPLCLEAQDCVECNDRLNGDYINIYPDINIEYNNECIRLYNIDTTGLRTYELVMRNKINESYMLKYKEKEKLYYVLIKNKEVFENRLGKCTSCVHKFEVAEPSAELQKGRN